MCMPVDDAVSTPPHWLAIQKPPYGDAEIPTAACPPSMPTAEAEFRGVSERVDLAVGRSIQ